MAKPLNQDTRRLLLDIAEQLFAEQGINGVSIRSINAEANLSPGILHYHFGNKDTLVEAIINRRLVDIIDQRNALLAQLNATQVSNSDIAKILIQPLHNTFNSGGQHFIQLLNQLYIGNNSNLNLIQAKLQPSDTSLANWLHKLMPEHEIEPLATRLQLAHQTALHNLALMDKTDQVKQKEIVNELNLFIAAGLVAH